MEGCSGKLVYSFKDSDVESLIDLPPHEYQELLSQLKDWKRKVQLEAIKQFLQDNNLNNSFTIENTHR